MAAKFDVVIAGARCAGAAAALLVARRGGRVLVVDRSSYGSDTLSTHALMRGGVMQLFRWGLLERIVEAGTPAIRSTTFGYVDRDVTVAIEPRFGVDTLYAPRRTVLDRVLADAALEAGVEIHYGSLLEDVVRDTQGRVSGVVVRYRGATERIKTDLVVGADGRHSTVARIVGAETRREAQHSTAVLFTYWEGLPNDGYYWGFRPDAAIGCIPTNDGQTCVFVALPWERFRDEMRDAPFRVYRRLIANSFASFDARLQDARLAQPVHGFGGQRGFIRQTVGPGWALVGDAGYFKDPLTAHGITDALRDAELLARAVQRGTADAFADYERTQRELSEPLFDVSDEIASFTWTDDRVQTLHKLLSVEMAREVRALAALDADVRGTSAPSMRNRLRAVLARRPA